MMSENAQPILARYGDVPEGYDPQTPWSLDLAPQRKELADSLTRLFRQSNKPFVLAVNAGWGMGKSLFLRMWRDDLQNQGHPCVLFNAWEYDHTNTPLLSFITALDRQVNTHWPDTLKRKGKDFLKTVPQKMPGLLNAAIQGVTAAFFPGTGAEGVAGQSAQAAAEAIVGGSKRVAEDRDTFRKDLAGFVKKLTQDAPAPLIIMVDELDRCRPDFAIALLEDIKHLFSVEGVVFVLAVEKKQLSNCIGATYGLDAEGSVCYLNKFIEMSLELPAPELLVFMRQLLSTYPLPNPSAWPQALLRHNWLSYRPEGHHILTFADLACEIIRQFPLSLRDTAQVFCRLSVIAQSGAICPLGAIACALLLAWIQRGGALEEGLRGLQNFAHHLQVAGKERTFFEAPALYVQGRGLCTILQCVLGKIEPNYIHNLADSLQKSKSMSSTQAEALNYLFRLTQQGATGPAWIDSLKKHLSLSERITIE